MLEKSIVNLSCKNVKNIPSGDHIIFICQIIELHMDVSLKPLIYVNKKYTQLK